jgi:Ca2+-binding EF-hand superfamily protein
MILKLAVQESMGNIKDPEFTHADGKVDPLPTGVPRGWESLEKMPKSGIFKACYNCAPELRKYGLRTMLAESFGGFKIAAPEKEVEWWTGLQEPPEDVLDWLEFCLGKFDTMEEAFLAIDGVDGNGSLSLREFEEAIRELECEKFKDKDEKQRIAGVFRYLDPGGEGSVSKEEWCTLDQLAKEFNLCIKEFVAFLDRMYGGDIETWWEIMDDDDSGELTLQEWMEAVQKLGYFGPAKCVFNLLDNSDDGNISLDEFAVLQKYHFPKVEKPPE